jgi:bisanhydrobacterioruberin hydratase
MYKQIFTSNYNEREQYALIVAIAFHLFGLIGMLMGISFFKNSTPIHLLVCTLLIMYTHRKPNLPFFSFAIFAFGLGMIVEILGVNTGIFFGDYAYGQVMGPMFKGVPFTIGLNWFVVLYMCAVLFGSFQRMSLRKMAQLGMPEPNKIYLIFSFITNVAGLAVLFDWILEPAAIKLGFWQWKPNNEIPLYNYMCWAIFSLPIAAIAKYTQIELINKFAIHLLMIQTLFFLILRTFL